MPNNVIEWGLVFFFPFEYLGLMKYCMHVYVWITREQNFKTTQREVLLFRKLSHVFNYIFRTLWCSSWTLYNFHHIFSVIYNEHTCLFTPMSDSQWASALCTLTSIYTVYFCFNQWFLKLWAIYIAKSS